MVLNHYLIIGSGRIAYHFCQYFQLLGLPFNRWDRSQSLEHLHSSLTRSSQVLLLISDSAIETFWRENLKAFGGRVLHFSGALEIAGIESIHPLMSFSKDVYDLDTYRQIPFITTSKLSIPELLPGLDNTIFHIRPDQKAYYHALCVMSGNFTTLLWQKMSIGLRQLNLPVGIETAYRKQIFKNLETNLETALTGPLARKDLSTVIANDQALQGDDYQKIYRAFLSVHFPEALSQLETAI
jgi:hypothetical protein